MLICIKCFSLSALFLLSFAAQAVQVGLPTDEEIQGIKNLCAGGDVKQVEAKLDAALQAWKRDPEVKLDASAAKRNLGAVLEKVKADAGGAALYKEYVGCVQNLIEKYLARSAAVSAEERCKPVPTRVTELVVDPVQEAYEPSAAPLSRSKPSCSGFKQTAKTKASRQCFEDHAGRIVSWESEECECHNAVDLYWSCEAVVTGQCEYKKVRTVLKSPC